MENLPVVNLASLVVGTRALGPGNRSVVWVQGCPFRCRGCIAPSWIPIKTAHIMAPENLARVLLSDPGITGITLSGGEPMLQAPALAETIRIAKGMRDVDVICFTGFQYGDLQKTSKEGVKSLLSSIDVLIDGPYIESLNDGVGLRGSKNQKIHFLTERLKWFDFEGCARKVDLQLAKDELQIVGIPSRQILSAFESALSNPFVYPREVAHERS